MSSTRLPAYVATPRPQSAARRATPLAVMFVALAIALALVASAAVSAVRLWGMVS